MDLGPTSILRTVCGIGAACVFLTIATPQMPSFANGLSQKSGTVCPAPPEGLSQGTPNTNAEMTPFTSEGSSYEIEVASAFAPRTSNMATSYCLRYEAENMSSTKSGPNQGRIDLFYWPSAQISVQKFEVGRKFRQSLIRSDLGAQPPSLGSTDLFAFKNAAFSSTAYKVGSIEQSSQLVTRVSLVLDSKSSTRDVPDGIEMAQELDKRFLADDTPAIGAVWGSGGTQVAATTALDTTKATDQISISIEVSGDDGIQSVYAPFAKALSYAKTSTDLPVLLSEFRQSPVKFEGGTAEFKNAAAVDLQSPDTRLFAIQQPVILTVADGGKVCFLAPTYSPIPIPKDFQTCDPKVVFGDR
jgi:hypothetical protein